MTPILTIRQERKRLENLFGRWQMCEGLAYEVVNGRTYPTQLEVEDRIAELQELEREEERR